MGGPKRAPRYMTFLGHNKTYLCYYYIKGISRGSISDNLDEIFDHILKIDGIVNILLLSFQTKNCHNSAKNENIERWFLQTSNFDSTKILFNKN